jgi:hypothetical protein
MDPVDPKRLRGILAEAQVNTSEFARACQLSRVHVGHILSGRVEAGELATFKIRRGLAVLGLDREVQHAS